MELTKGAITESGFKILDIVDLKEAGGTGIFARHIRTAAEVFHIHNDDKENTFAFIFKTLPEDSTGAFHIIEHSVLCGSERFPLKDAFIVLAQGSLQTYLNAWTFPDKTVYPASSVNEKDYFNLMNVYGDAVFRPKLAEWTFLQEGRRFEFVKEQDGRMDENHLTLNGVVYNEMKGAYSSPDEYAAQWSIKSVLPDTLYAFDSGGDPACIPNLDYNGFLALYKKYYCAANTKIFLHGNIPTGKQLAFLNDTFLADAQTGKKAPIILPPERWPEPRRFLVPSPAGADNKPTVFVSWLCNEYNFSGGTDAAYKALVFDVLSELLLGHDGAPLAKALVNSGLGEDMANVCGFEDEIKFNVFTAGLRGVKNEKKARNVEKHILRVLKRLALKGVPEKEIEAALFAEEFNEREIKRPQSGPWALVLLRRALRGWLHGALPWQTLLVKSSFERLKEELKRNSRFFEDFIQKELLDNPHRALVTVKPDETFTAQKQREYQQYMAEKEAALDSAARKSIRQKAELLEQVQNEKDSPEALAAIPHISLHDLERDIIVIPRTAIEADGIPVLSHKLPTNGITYAAIAMPVDGLPFDDYIYLPLFTHCINAVGTASKSWADVSGKLARTVGDFYASLHSGTELGFFSGLPDARARDWIVFSFKTMDEKLESAFSLISAILREADFSDTRRLKTLILEMRNTAVANMAAAGTALAALRAESGFQYVSALNELWHGVTQLDFVHKLPDVNIKATAKRLLSIRNALVRKAGLMVNITGENEQASLSLIQKYLSDFGPLSPPPPEAGRRRSSSAGINAFSAGEKGAVEVFSSEILQVGFSAMTLRSHDIRSAEAAAEEVLAHYLSTGAFWEKLRMKCGAYGANCSVNHIHGTAQFSTYRDPSPSVSIQAIPEIIREIAEAPVTADALEKTLIGVYSKINQPNASGKSGSLDFIRYLNGIDDAVRRAKLSHILSMEPQALQQAARYFADAAAPGDSSCRSVCVISGGKEAEKAAAAYGVPLQRLPV